MDIIGHDRVIHYLSEGMRTDRLSPSLMFIGPDGVGKRSCALEFAKSFACTEPGFADGLPRCGKCPACRRIDGGNHLDLMVVDRNTQAAILNEKPETQTTVKINSIRALDKFLRLRCAESRRRVAIVEDAHKMTDEAANALLKVLEEPPPAAQIILCATDEHSLPATVRSRCAVLYFRPVAEGIIASWLERVHGVEPERAADIADRSSGSFRKALDLKEDDGKSPDLSDYSTAEFFALLSESGFRKEGRKTAETVLTKLIETAERRLRGGDVTQAGRIEALLEARRRVDGNVPPRLALEAVFLKLRRLEKEPA